MSHIQSGIKESDEEAVRELLKDNFDDYIKLRNEHGVSEEDSKEQEGNERSDFGNFFIYLEEAEW